MFSGVLETLQLFAEADCNKTTTYAYLALLIGTWNQQEIWRCSDFERVATQGAKNLVEHFSIQP